MTEGPKEVAREESLEGLIVRLLVDGLGFVDEIVAHPGEEVSEEAGLANRDKLIGVNVGEKGFAAGDQGIDQGSSFFFSLDAPVNGEDAVEVGGGGVVGRIDVDAEAFGETAPLSFVGMDGGDENFHRLEFSTTGRLGMETSENATKIGGEMGSGQGSEEDEDEETQEVQEEVVLGDALEDGEAEEKGGGQGEGEDEEEVELRGGVQGGDDGVAVALEHALYYRLEGEGGFGGVRAGV